MYRGLIKIEEEQIDDNLIMDDVNSDHDFSKLSDFYADDISFSKK